MSFLLNLGTFLEILSGSEYWSRYLRDADEYSIPPWGSWTNKVRQEDIHSMSIQCDETGEQLVEDQGQTLNPGYEFRAPFSEEIPFESDVLK